VSICQNCLNTEIDLNSALTQPLVSLKAPLKKKNGGQFIKKSSTDFLLSPHIYNAIQILCENAMHTFI
jgi:hypothetical protein